MSKRVSTTLLLTLAAIGLVQASRVAFRDLKNVDQAQQKDADASPNILIAAVVRNQAHALPTFLAALETLRCPNRKRKCDLWFIFDNCTDNSYEMFIDWLSETRMSFDTIMMLNTKNDERTRLKHTELDPLYFAPNLKKRALKYALDRKFNYVFFLNADTVLTNPGTVEALIGKRKSVVAPMLTSTFSGGSTFSSIHFQDAEDIYARRTVGCFKAFSVQESYLLDLSDARLSSLLGNTEVESDVPVRLRDDLEFSRLAVENGILMHVCNREQFGYVLDANPGGRLDEAELFVHLQLEHLLAGPNRTYNAPLPVSAHLAAAKEKKRPRTRLGFDQIYVINLERRADRRARVEASLEALNLAYKLVKAVDAKRDVNAEMLESLGVRVIPDYKDPYNDRPLNYGEIGCFLSHYGIWQEVVEKQLDKVVVLEDDARFGFNFKSVLRYLAEETKARGVVWDLMYLGRKVMREYADEEVVVEAVPSKNGHGLVYPSYTHWTVAYALTLEGARKLLAAEPLKHLLPVDEYLPLMYNKQPNEYWTKFYPTRDLVAVAVEPTIVAPTHYTGEPNHVSDTEYTPVIDTARFEGEKPPPEPKKVGEDEDEEAEGVEKPRPLFKEVPRRINIEL